MKYIIEANKKKDILTKELIYHLKFQKQGKKYLIILQFSMNISNSGISSINLKIIQFQC